MTEFYPYAKSLHLIGMVCWFAGIFYLPRLFVYHAMSDDQISRDRFEIMERKLYRGIMWPSMVITVLFGAWMLVINPGWLTGMAWLHVKLTLVAALIAFHLMCGHYIKAFKNGTMNKSHKYFRFFNEVPVLILLAVIFLAVLKPF